MLDQFSGRAYQRLLARVQRQYSVLREPITLGTLQMLYHRVSNPDVVLQQMAQEEGPQGVLPWQPYWAHSWDATIPLATELTRLPLAECRVLDLGCGLGLTGAVAAARGACVWMVDAAPPALLFARLNSWSYRERVTIRRIDWSRDSLAGPGFDWILGSDIAYDRQDWHDLELFLRRHLAVSGRILLGDPCRRVSDEFIAWLEKKGWRYILRFSPLSDSSQRVRFVEARLPPPERRLRAGSAGEDAGGAERGRVARRER